MKTILRIQFLSVLFALGCSQSERQAVTQPPPVTASSENPASVKNLLENARYVDDNSCADCHADIFDSYQHVAMAKSFYDFDPTSADESLVNNQFYHEPSQNYYAITSVDGDLQVTRWQQRNGGTKKYLRTQNAQYVIGSGNHTKSYLYRNSTGEMYQLPVAWYSQEKKWAMAPGYDRPDHPDFDRPITRQCMFCHNAYPSFEKGSDVFGMPHRFPAKMPQGIGCQRCHGPGSEHVRIAEDVDADNQQDVNRVKKSIVNPNNLSPVLQDSVCNQCHLQPMSQRTSLVTKFGRNDYGYRAGQPLEDFRVHFEPDRNNEIADHFEINHHPYRLRQSKCFLNSPNGIRCTHCHDPHAGVSIEARPRHYREKCFSCHSSNDCLDIKTGRLPDANCVNCHMPQRRTTDVIHVTMTDHKIARRSKLDDPVAPLSEIDVPLDLPIREYALAGKKLPKSLTRLYELFARSQDDDETSFDPFEREVNKLDRDSPVPSLQLAQKLLQHQKFDRAEKLLTRISGESSALAACQINSGISALGRREFETAVARLTRATSADPNSAQAWYNLGVAQSRLGETAAAIESLLAAVRLRPSYVKARNRSGSIYALNDDLLNAARQFEIVLQLDVRNLEACQKLSAVYRRQGKWQDCIELLNDALRIDQSNEAVWKDLAAGLLEVNNRKNRSPQLVLEAANKYTDLTDGSLDAAVLTALALIENKKPNASLELAANHRTNDDRKAELGLLIAIAQEMLGSKNVAAKNFESARRALNQQKTDRLSRIVLETAESHFATPADSD